MNVMLWLEIIGLVLGVSLLEGSVTGTLPRPRSRSHWPIPLRLRPVFGIFGFGLLAFAFIDFFLQFIKP